MCSPYLVDQSECNHASPPSLTSESSSASASPNPRTYHEPQTPPEKPAPAPCSAPGFEQFRSGPFGYIFDGLRLTTHERSLLETMITEGITAPGEAVYKPTSPILATDVTANSLLDTKEANPMDPLTPLGSASIEPTTSVVTSYDQDQDTYTSPAGIAIPWLGDLDVDDWDAGANSTRSMHDALNEFFDLEEACEDILDPLR